MKSVNLIPKYLFIFFSVFLLISCATQIEQREQLEKPTTGQSVVFGHADVIVDGKVQEWGLSWMGTKSCCLLLLPPSSNNAMTYQINDNGMFYFSLDPGEYQLLGFRFVKDTASRVGRIGGAFSVPDDTETIYIGNISIDMHKGRYVTLVNDDIAGPLAEYKAKYPQRSGEVKTSLLKLPDKLGKFNRVLHECNELWGVDCSDDFRGVTPLTPEVKTQSLMPGKQPFPKTDSLTAMFSWKPADKQGVTYDLIIYDAATYGFGLGDKQYIKGRMVLYVENLSTSNYQLEKPLKGNTRYYWSVRLRDADTVSRWSTFSHFGFYLIYSTSGYGQWFAFSTP